MSNFAWVTLATNDSYSLGALVVANSLKKAQTKHQLAVLITPGVTTPMRVKLATAFDVVQEVNVLDSKDAANLSLLKRPELGVTFTKLHCWRLTQFEKCVFLDADTLVLQNCDELFEREELSAAPDVGWPDCFNSGVFVYRPSIEQFTKLTAFAVQQGSFDGGDQGLLNLYFADWATKDINHRLPFVYNTCSTACYSYLPAFKQFGQGVKIMHFIGQLKPWLVNFDSTTRQASTPEGHGHLAKYLQLWWDIFCAEIHPKLSTDMGGLAGALAQLTLGEPRTSEQQAYEESMRQQCWESGNIDYLGTTNTLAKKTTQQSRNVAISEQRRSSVTKSVQQSTTIATSSTERRSSVTSTSSMQQQQQQQQLTESSTTSAAAEKVTKKKSEDKSSKKQQKTAKSSATKKSSTETTQKPGIDVNQPIIIVPGHQKVEFDATTNTKTVTERTTTGYQQTITTVSDEGLTKTQVKTFFDPVEIAGEETIEEEEETYEEVIETTEPTTRTTTSKTTTGQSDLVTQQIAEQQQTTTTSTNKNQAQVVSARELPKSTVTKRLIGEEQVRYETVVSEDGKTTTTRKIVTTPGEEIEIVEYEEQEVTEPREVKVVTTTKTIPTLANIRSERSHSQSVEVVEMEEHTSKSTTTKQQVQQQKQQKKVDTQCKTETKVSEDGREVETIEYEEQRITEPAAAPKTKTTTKTTTVPSSAKSTKKTTTEENVKKISQQQQLAKRIDEFTTVSQIPASAVVQTTLPDGQEVQVETSLSEDGKTKLLTKTIRQPEEDVEVEDYEETRTTVPRKITTKSKDAVVSVSQTDDEELNTIKTDKTRTRTNKMASETILVDAQSDRPIGQHQQVATSLERSNVTGVATTSVDAKLGSVTSKVAASETNTKSLNQEEVTVLPNQTKTSKKSETHTESRTITSSQTSSGGNVRQQRDSLTDTNLAAIRQKQQTIASVDKSVTAAVTDKSTTSDSSKLTKTKLSEQLKQSQRTDTSTSSDVQKRTQLQQQNIDAKSNKTDRSTTTTTSSTTTTQQQQQQQQMKAQLESQMKLSSKDKKFTSQVVSTNTDPKTGEVTTEEVRHFAGGREHIYTTVRNDGTMKMASKTFFDAVPVEGSEEEYEETTTTTTGAVNTEELAKKKLHRAVSSKETAAGDVTQPIPPPRKKEVKPMHPTPKSK